MAEGDIGRYRSWVDERRWRHGQGIATTIATRDASGSGLTRPAIRVLRARPGAPAPDAVDAGGARVFDEHIDLLEITIEVHRNPPKDEDVDMPEDRGQGESILLDRDQAVALRRALDAFVEDAVVLLPHEAETEAIAEQIRASGDPFGRTA